MASQHLYPIHSLYYDGAPQQPQGRKRFLSVNPATAHPWAELIESSLEDCDAALRSAAQAFSIWSQTPVIERSRILLKAAQILRSRNHDLAVMESRDTGKAYSETSTGDIVGGADVIEFYANLIAGGQLNGETWSLTPESWVHISKEALGVCVGIGAWNYPLQIALWKAGPCLAAGNTMVYKPSEYTPVHAGALAAIFTEAGCPPGTFNVVQGGPSVGAYLTSHPTVVKVSFTGQVSTGQKVASSAAGNMKYVTMELGGKSACIILEDADIEDAVNGAIMANFFSTGQICTNGTRVFIPDKMKADFEKILVDRIQYIRIGHPEDTSTNFGPLASRMQYEKVVSYIRYGIEVDKARLVCGGLDKPQGMQGDLKDGYWIQPTVFSDCTDDMRIVQEEIFGPVMSILTYHTVEEAVRRANATSLGLAGGVFTKDLNMARKIVSQLQARIIWVNTWGESPADMSVGGFKMSGLGVENGKRGLDSWYRTKSALVSMKKGVDTVFAKL